MSSEMRDKVQRVADSIAEFCDADVMPEWVTIEHWRDLLREYLLARTEAGADGEKGVNNHEWPLLDRVEFALRDAGFDYDEAFRIAHLAAHPQDASGDARYSFLRDWFLSDGRRMDILPAGHVKRYTPEEFDAAVDAAMQAKEAK
jgi:hypothetical protein